MYAKTSGPMPVLKDFMPGEISLSETLCTNQYSGDVPRACVCVPTRIGQFQAIVDDSVVIEEFSTENPVAAMEASQV
jgi:hypothetical protein